MWIFPNFLIQSNDRIFLKEATKLLLLRYAKPSIIKQSPNSAKYTYTGLAAQSEKTAVDWI
jgi:hypothetical protein